MILIRHGQSAWNVVFSRTRIDPYLPDPLLTEEGRRQALAAAESLAEHGIRRLIASPYRRALQTADLIADRTGLVVEVEPLVRERAAYSCDIGTPRSLLAAAWPHLSFDHLDEIWWPASEEPETALAARCHRFRADMASRSDWSRTAVISHWGFIRALTGVQAGNGDLVPFDPTADARGGGD